MINYERLTIFDKEFKRLFKKYRSLDKDLDIFKATLELFPTGQSNNSEIIHHTPMSKLLKLVSFVDILKVQP
jgi:hypothetical protein